MTESQKLVRKLLKLRSGLIYQTDCAEKKIIFEIRNNCAKDLAEKYVGKFFRKYNKYNGKAIYHYVKSIDFNRIDLNFSVKNGKPYTFATTVSFVDNMTGSICLTPNNVVYTSELKEEITESEYNYHYNQLIERLNKLW